MKRLLAVLLLAISSASFSQSTVTIIGDTIANKKQGVVLSNGNVIWEGDNLKCGRGTLPNGDFKYIHTSGSSWVALASAKSDGTSPGIMPLGRSFSGLNLAVKTVKKAGNKRRGYKYILKVGGGNIVNYEVELADAIATGEISI